MTLDEHEEDWELIQIVAKALSLRVYDVVNTVSSQGQAILCDQIRGDAHSVMSCLKDANIAPNQRLQCTYMGVAEDKINCLAQNLEQARKLDLLDSGVVNELAEDCNSLLQKIDYVLRSIAEDSRITCLIEEYETIWASKSSLRFHVG
jgi:four helix bundle protein